MLMTSDAENKHVAKYRQRLSIKVYIIYIYIYFYVQRHLFKNVTQGKAILLTSSPNSDLRDLKLF